MSQIKKVTLIAALGVLSALSAGTAWSTRAFNDHVLGQVTATPISGQIEVGQHTYTIRKNSSADETFRSFSPGQMVDLLMDGPVGSSTSQVIAITLQSASAAP
jgi:hypothetical protein